jgi:lipopolysaccharide export LptBFGC system permease protein LptF
LRLIGRYVFREILSSAVLGTLLATCVIFLQRVDKLFEVLVGAGNAAFKTVVTLLPWPCPRCCP